MPAYLGLIRAIGPVTHAKMRMAALRDACTDAGLDDVTTIGNTGNILCRSRKRADGVRKLLQEVVDGFGLGPANEVFVREPGQMEEVVAANPFPKVALERPDQLGVGSFQTTPDWAPIRDWYGPEQIAMVGAHLIVAYPVGISGSKLNVEKLLGARMTMRNWRVFAGLSEKLAALGR